ncbi:hypothetical protein ACMYR3_01050 [Ampullimonas aquatilis]|uniref:hypothetical protein n=1 Tax=Ampullimonas aquatilis TaxID=1341549 RepID=UPI003C788D1B
MTFKEKDLSKISSPAKKPKLVGQYLVASSKKSLTDIDLNLAKRTCFFAEWNGKAWFADALMSGKKVQLSNQALYWRGLAESADAPVEVAKPE